MNTLNHKLKLIKLSLAFLILSFCLIESKAQDNDNKHPSVYKINISNKYIDPNGTILLYTTLNRKVGRGTCYEFYNNKTFCTTLFNIHEEYNDTNIYYRHPKNTNSFTQMVYVGRDLPIVFSFELSQAQIKEIVAGSRIYRIVRGGEFIQIISIKDLNGNILGKIY